MMGTSGFFGIWMIVSQPGQTSIFALITRISVWQTGQMMYAPRRRGPLLGISAPIFISGRMTTGKSVKMSLAVAGRWGFRDARCRRHAIGLRVIHGSLGTDGHSRLPGLNSDHCLDGLLLLVGQFVTLEQLVDVRKGN